MKSPVLETFLVGAKEGDVGSKTTCQLNRKGQDAFFLMTPVFHIDCLPSKNP